jgi:hypothetical protein
MGKPWENHVVLWENHVVLWENHGKTTQQNVWMVNPAVSRWAKSYYNPMIYSVS